MSGIRWTQKHIDDLVAAGKVKSVVYTTAKRDKPVLTEKKPHSPGKVFIPAWLKEQRIDYVTEWRFDEKRRFRFDWAIVALKIAIEYEGLVATGKKGGHQTKKHFTSNCDKYNLALSLGWRVYRYTALNYKNIENDLKELLK